MTDLVHDPRSFEYRYEPAVVETKGPDGVESVGYASVQLRDSGALLCRQWDGERMLLPDWRWLEVRYIPTERASSEDGSKVRQRIPADCWDQLPDAVRQALDADAQEVEVR